MNDTNRNDTDRGGGTAETARPMGRILALDLGSRRIGVALSDPMRIIAQPHGTVNRKRPTDDVRRIVRICGEYEAVEVVVGLPLSMDGEVREPAEAAQAFASRLADASGLPVHLWDERLTTVAAERALIESGMRRNKRREVIDQTFLSDVDTDLFHRVSAVSDPDTQRIWVMYPGQGHNAAGTPNKVLIYDWTLNRFSHGELGDLEGDPDDSPRRRPRWHETADHLLRAPSDPSRALR